MSQRRGCFPDRKRHRFQSRFHLVFRRIGWSFCVSPALLPSGTWLLPRRVGPPPHRLRLPGNSIATRRHSPQLVARSYLASTSTRHRCACIQEIAEERSSRQRNGCALVGARASPRGSGAATCRASASSAIARTSRWCCRRGNRRTFLLRQVAEMTPAERTPHSSEVRLEQLPIDIDPRQTHRSRVWKA